MYHQACLGLLSLLPAGSEVQLLQLLERSVLLPAMFWWVLLSYVVVEVCKAKDYWKYAIQHFNVQNSLTCVSNSVLR